MEIERQTILVVDDEGMNVGILTKALKEDYRVLAAKSGEKALQIVEKGQVDLILLDIIMPEMDGYEVLQRLKNNEISKNIPVIFITSKTEEQEEAKGLQMGAVDYIKKPFYLPILEARVRTHLELKMKNDILNELVALDGLTNIFNRRKFDDTLIEEWKRAQRSKAPLSLLVIDVDHFKYYNDNYGHTAGDVCLRRVASALKSCLRRPGDFLARYGGEEFTIILPNTGRDGCTAVAASVNRHVADLKLKHEYSPVAGFVTVSVGGAIIVPNLHGAASRGLIDQADQMLFAAKKSGRNTFRIHE